MTSQAVSGVGTILHKWNGAAWVAIGEINNITGPGMSRDTIDVTSLASTGGYKEFIPGFRDGGVVTFSMNFVRDDYDSMKSDFESDTLVNYEIVINDADKTSIEFTGMVTELPLTISAEDKITCDVTIKVSGQASVDSGSGS